MKILNSILFLFAFAIIMAIAICMYPIILTMSFNIAIANAFVGFTWKTFKPQF